MSSPVIICKDFHASLDSKIIHIDGCNVHVGLTDYTQNLNNDYIQDQILEKNPDFVLVKKKGFSCNYRDKAILISATITPKLKFCAFGSDFVGSVQAIGRNVTNLALGDKVIPNSAYAQSKYSTQLGIPTNFASREYQYFNYGKLIKIPDNMSIPVAASFTINAQTVYSIIEKLNINSDTKGKILIWSASSNTSPDWRKSF